MVYLKSVENVITLCKLIGPLLLFCLPLLSILFLNDLARPVMGTIFLVIYMCFFFYMVCNYLFIHLFDSSIIYRSFLV